jgi:hypothetical protein
MNNPRKAKAIKAKYRSKPLCGEFLNSRKRVARYREHLVDSYVRSLLKESGINNPTPEQIEQKREQLKLIRLINEKQRAIKS